MDEHLYYGSGDVMAEVRVRRLRAPAVTAAPVAPDVPEPPGTELLRADADGSRPPVYQVRCATDPIQLARDDGQAGPVPASQRGAEIQPNIIVRKVWDAMVGPNVHAFFPLLGFNLDFAHRKEGVRFTYRPPGLSSAASDVYISVYRVLRENGERISGGDDDSPATVVEIARTVGDEEMAAKIEQLMKELAARLAPLVGWKPKARKHIIRR